MIRWKIEKLMIVNKAKRHKKEIDKWIGIRTDVLKSKKYRERVREEI